MQWLSATQAARRLQVCRPTFARIAAAAKIRRQVLPGRIFVRYSAEDVDRIARESVTGGVEVIEGGGQDAAPSKTLKRRRPAFPKG